MAYILSSAGKPYYTTGSKVFACEVAADKIKVDFSKAITGVKKKTNCVYTEAEIKKCLNIKMVDSWDEVNEKVVKVSNKVVSSIVVPEPPEEPAKE